MKIFFDIIVCNFLAGIDYIEVDQQLIFAANTDPASTAQCFPVIAIDNNITDGDRTFSLQLTGSNLRVLSSPVQIIIEDDERKQSALIELLGYFFD